MKKQIIILFAFLACITTANAQWTVGGSFGFSSTKIDNGGSDQSGSSFKIVPDIAYKVDDVLTIGVQLGYSHGLATFGSLTATDIKSALSTMAGAYVDVNNDDMKLNGFSIAPYLRYSVLNFGKASLFLEGYMGFNSIKTDSTPSTNGGSGDEASLTAFELGVRPGISLMVSEKLELLCKLGALGFITAKEKESDAKITRFGLDVSSYNLMLGFGIHF